MKSLTILYDQQCGFCRQCRQWLEAQPAYLPVSFLSCRSEEVAKRFPGVEAYRPTENLVVVADTGEVYVGDSAWLMCLFALKQYRGWARRLSTPLLRPLARQVFEQISGLRGALSCVIQPGESGF